MVTFPQHHSGPQPRMTAESGRTSIKIPIGHLHSDDLGRTVRVSAQGAHSEGLLISATHRLRRDKGSETTLELSNGAHGSMSSTWPSATPCQLAFAGRVAGEPIADVPTDPDLLLAGLRSGASLELAGRRG